MTAHTADCDGFYYVGRGGVLPHSDDDSVICTGQCLAVACAVCDETVYPNAGRWTDENGNDHSHPQKPSTPGQCPTADSCPGGLGWQGH